MTSNPNLVPSKNALRTLRNLAFAHPTLFFGAVGSACCVAALNCEVQRRVRVAEKVVATKRTLKSISNGKRSNRVAQMIEAAEKGESYLMGPRSGQRRQRPRPRSYATAVAEREDDDNSHVPLVGPLAQELDYRQDPCKQRSVAMTESGDKFRSVSSVSPTGHSSRTMATTFDNSVQRNPHPPRGSLHSATRYTPRSRAATKAEAAETSQSSLTGTTNYAWKMDSQRQHNSASAEKLKAASTRALKPGNYHVYGRTRQAATEDTEDVSISSRSYTEAESMDQHRPISLASDEELASIGSVSATAAATGLNSHGRPLEVRQDWNAGDQTPQPRPFDISSSRDDAVISHKYATDSVPGRLLELETVTDHPIQGEEDEHEVAPTAPFRWQSPASDFLDFSAPVEDPPESSTGVGEIGDQSAAFVLQSRMYFTNISDTHLSSRSPNNVMLKQSTILASSPSRPVKGLPGTLSTLDEEIALLVKAGQPERAVQIYHARYDPDRHGILPPAATLLVHSTLSDISTQHHALDILFSEHYPSGGRGPPQVRLWSRADLYMKEICKLRTDPEDWKEQVTLILDGARANGYSLHGRALESVTRSMCALGQVEQAETWIQAMTAEYGLLKHLKLDECIVLAHARNHNWSAVNRIMQALQEEETSRERPYWYSNLFEQILKLHLQRHQLESTYDYLINAMGYWRLAPTRNISCTLIAACIEAGDYHHLQQWIEAMRAMWPRLDLGTGSRPLADSIADIWQDKQVTCEHIERACCALAWGAIADPFSPYLRSIILDNVQADLRKQISNCERYVGRNPGTTGVSPERLSDLISRAGTCLERSPVSQQNAAEWEFARKRLSCQLQAVQSLFRVIGGELPENMTFVNEPVETDLIFVDRSIEPAIPRIPKALQSTSLPHMQQYWPILADIYVEQHEKGRVSNHNALEHVVSTLQRQGRYSKVAELLGSICASPFVIGEKGKPLTAQLYENYLDVATRLNAPKHSHRAMWAVLDACRDVDLTPRMLLRAARCCHNASKHDTHERQLRELDYLYHRLRKTRWIQMGMPEKPDRLPEWKSWEERVRAGTRGSQHQHPRDLL